MTPDSYLTEAAELDAAVLVLPALPLAADAESDAAALALAADADPDAAAELDEPEPPQAVNANAIANVNAKTAIFPYAFIRSPLPCHRPLVDRNPQSTLPE